MDSLALEPNEHISEVANGREGALEHYLAEVSRVPVLTRSEEIALARRIEGADQGFRRELFSIPRAAEEIVETRRSLRRQKRSTGRLSASFGSGGPARSRATQRLDRSLERVEVLLRQRERVAPRHSRVDREALEGRIRQALCEADLSLQFVEEVRLRLRPFEEPIGDVVRERARLDEPRRRPRSAAGQQRRRRSLRTLGERRRALESEVGMSASEFLRTVERMESQWSALVEARNRFVRHNLRLVVKLARFYAANSSMALVDLIQEGNIGLLRAAEKFDHLRGYKFSTYAVWWIRQSMIRAIQRGSRTIRLPSHVQDTLRKYRRAEAELEEQGVAPSREQVLEHAQLDPEKRKYIARAPAEPFSLEATLPGTDSETTLGDVVADPDGTFEPETLDQGRLEGLMCTALSPLPDRERKLLCWRFGLAGEREHTLEAIGRRLQLSRERVRQLEARALEKVKRGPASDDLRILWS